MWSMITVAAFLLCAAKFITKRAGSAKADKLMLKLHLLGGVLLPVGACVHGYKASQGNRPLWLRLTGAVCFAGVTLLMFSHFFSKLLGKAAMPLHRASTLLTGAGIALHAVSAAKTR